MSDHSNNDHDDASRSGLTRRHFIQTSAAIGGLGGAALVLPAAQAANTPFSLEGYASATSVLPGGTLDFFLRDPQAVGAGVTPYTLTITRTGAPDVFVTSYTVDIGNPAVPANASTAGCNWPVNLRLSVPANWPTGVYYAYIGAGENACTVPFVVRAASPTPGVRRLVCIPVTTVYAYNAYGGKSLYDYNSSGGVRASQVSMNRPLTQSFNSFFDVYSQYLVRWLAKNGLAADFCTDLDIAANPALLDGCQLYIQAGHDEYWTIARRRTMDAFVARGGNCVYLGGNTAWFAIRMESSGGVANRSIVCYKDAASDPVTDPTQKTINFYALATPYPENITTGLGFRFGCSWASAVPPRPNTPTKVMRPEHWAFAGTGLARDAQFGGEFVGYEADAAEFTLGAADQRPYATGSDGSPAALRILASADASNWNALSLAGGGGGEQSGHAMIAVFSRGGVAGTVFNAGSTDWPYGLAPELNGQTPTPISRITLNAITKLSTAWSESADVRQFRRAAGGGSGSIHYYGTEAAAPAGIGLVLDGFAFRAFLQALVGTSPVYRYRSSTPGTVGTRWRYSLSSALATATSGWVLEGVAFHAYASARTDTTAVYEHLQTVAAGTVATLYSMQAAPPAGWAAGPVVFYAPSDGTVPAAAPAPSFLLSAMPTTLQIARGRSATVAVSVNRLFGFDGVVSFSLLGLPAGVTASFSPPSSTTASTLTLTAASNAALGTAQITVRGSSAASGATPALTVDTVLTLGIVAATACFALAAPRHATLWALQGQTVCSNTLKVVPMHGFREDVIFSVSGLPAGVTAVFQPPRSTSGARLALQVAMAVRPGVYPLTVTGMSAANGSVPACMASTTLTLQVQVSTATEGFDFKALKDRTLDVRIGHSEDSDTIKIVQRNGFDEPVVFSVSGLPAGMSAVFKPPVSKKGAKLLVLPSALTPPGSYVVTVLGRSAASFSSPSLTATTTLTVVVRR